MDYSESTLQEKQNELNELTERCLKLQDEIKQLNNSKNIVKIIISLDITTNKDIEDIRTALRAGILKGLDSESYGIAEPNKVKINYIQQR